MKRIATYLALVLCLSTAAHALPAGHLNVKDFGAKGDGVTDDTKSIQAAFDKAGVIGSSGGSEVFFPYGIYLVSDELDARGVAIQGEGYAEILEKNPAKDIFHAKSAWRMTISGLSFNGGKNQVSLGNADINTGFLQVIDCRFDNSSGFAIEFRKGTDSTQTVVERCEFNDCYQVLYLATDEGIFRDSWISSFDKMIDKAVIEIVYGRVLIENICGVPRVNGTDQRWIDVDGSAFTNLVCRNDRFGGENGGFTPVVNHAKRTLQLTGPSITLENCVIAAFGNNKRKCAVYCEEIPNQIRIVDCRIEGVPALMIRPGIDLKTYFKGVRPGMLDYTVEHNIGEFQGELPPLLKKPFQPRLTFAENGILPPAQTAHRLAVAVRAETLRVEEAASTQPLISNGHVQQTDPRKYQTIPYNAATWRLDDFMDGTSDLNSDYLAMAPVKDRVLIMRRKTGGYPHVLIKNVVIDLDKYPFLTLLQKKALNPSPPRDALKIMDDATGVILDLDEGHDYQYRAFDLKKLFKTSGVRKFTLKYYYLGWRYIHGTSTTPFKVVSARPGDYILLDFIRAEAADRRPRRKRICCDHKIMSIVHKKLALSMYDDSTGN